MTSDRTCDGTNLDGTPCGAPPRLVDPSKGLCAQHDPERRDMMREAARRGGRASARKKRGLITEDLPPLDSHDAAELWAERVGRAAALGTITSSAANAALRAVKLWIEARESGEVSERLDALERAMQEWRRTGDPQPVQDLLDKWRRGGLRVVDGEARG